MSDAEKKKAAVSGAVLPRMIGEVAELLSEEDALRLAKACVDFARADADQLVAALTTEVMYDGEIVSDTTFVERLVATAPKALGPFAFRGAVLAALGDEELESMRLEIEATQATRGAAKVRRQERAKLEGTPEERRAKRCAQGHLWGPDKTCQRIGCGAKRVAPGGG